jgi:glycosyltransferase involved in cell wall biosynthesis
MKVSVVIPTYNRAKELSRCLRSLVNQSFKNFEVLVCDDGSDDETEYVVQKYSKQLCIRYHYSENSGGPAQPRNYGWRLAKADYIAFLDSDDWWLPKKLEESVRCLDSGADIVYHDLYLVKSEFQRWHWRRLNTYQLHTPVFQDLLERGNVIANSSVAIRKSLLEKVGGQTEETVMVAGEDYDCWLKVARHTERFVRLDKTLGYYWAGGGNITSPKQTKKLLFEFQHRYFQDSAERFPGWFYYAMGRALYHCSNYDDAKSYLHKAFINQNSSIVKLKIMFMLSAMFFRLPPESK